MVFLQRVFGGLVLKWIESADDSTFAKRYEQTRHLRRNKRPKIDYLDEKKMFKVDDGQHAVFVARRSRLHFQMNGIESRRSRLKSVYLLKDGILRPGDFVIDCGANIGEFSLMCAEAGAFVLAFEPDPTEFAALQANTQRCESVSVYRIALWNRAEELELFSSNETGDTSLIQPQRYSKTLKTTAMALDEFDDLPLAPKRIRLLKLEAEGAEPEILEGMEKTLPRVDYITADLGPERGAKMETTVAQATDFLYARGFRMIGFSPVRCVALFESEGAAR